MKMKSYRSKRFARQYLCHLKGLIVALLLLAVALPGTVTAAPQAQGAGYLPLTAKNACHDTRTPTVFGVQVYGTLDRRSPYFPSLQNSGTSWVRIPVDWHQIEPTNTTPENYKWGVADAVLRVARDSCVNVIATIEAAPEWAQAIPGASRGPIKTNQMAEFVQFVQALAERYDGDGIADSPEGIVVNYWELYNEPDLGPNPDGAGAPRWGEHGDQYAAMLKAVYTPIKTANPNATVVMGGIAYDNFQRNNGDFVESFLDDVLDNGGGQYFDVMNFHYYPAFKDDWVNGDQRGLPAKIAHLRQKLADRGLNKPFVITEAGWHSNASHDQYPSSDEEQSRYVVQLFAQSIASDLQFMIWWSFRDDLEYQYQNGLVTQAEGGQPPQEKPSYRVFQTAARRLSNAQYERMLSAADTQDPDLEVYQFTAALSGKRMYVAWLNPAGTDQTRPLSRPGSVATVYSKENVNLGVVHDGDDGAQDGRVTVHVGSSPVYIVVD